MLTGEDQRRIVSMVEKLKEAIDDLLEFRNVTQESYLPTLKNERALQEEYSQIKDMKEAALPSTT